ncbi:outer membrane insertion C- signal [Mangrovivirga cuniculi]|uniref:Outer membrane insertion C-signal n=1 Tax=Mangrovivirga cuniculi TaxID=2715131 RepID=A0A4D7JH02_9BACT|nr:outer membrane insertion C- signal [Mangrovivirga cuniculi]QCK15379.1 outer membrane insertion C- signal [Mangrovivirga cuniculi]
MKKVLFVFAFIFGTAFVGQSQELGVRFGGRGSGNEGSAAVDAVFATGKFNRIHANLSFGNDGVGIDALWDLIYRQLGGEAFMWYVGVGPYTVFGDDFELGGAGEIGLEYRFNIPIAIGVDWRPYFELIDDTDFNAGGFGINIRYVFGGEGGRNR